MTCMPRLAPVTSFRHPSQRQQMPDQPGLSQAGRPFLLRAADVQGTPSGTILCTVLYLECTLRSVPT